MSEQKKSAENKAPPRREDKKIGQILIEMGHINEAQLNDALENQKQLNSGGKRTFKIGEVLLFKKSITLAQLHAALRAQTNKAEHFRISSIESKKKFEEDRTATKESKKSKKDEKPQGGFFSFLKKKD